MFLPLFLRLSGFLLLTVTLSAGLAAYRQNTPARLTFDVEVTRLGPTGAPWLRLEYQRPNGSRVPLEPTLLSTRVGDGPAHYVVKLDSPRRISAVWGSVAGGAQGARVTNLRVQRHGEHAVPLTGAVPSVDLGDVTILMADGLGPYTGFGPHAVPSTLFPSTILAAIAVLLATRGRVWMGACVRWARPYLDAGASRSALLALLVAGGLSVEWRVAILSFSNAGKLSALQKIEILAEPVWLDLFAYAGALCIAAWIVARGRRASRASVNSVAAAFALAWFSIGVLRASDIVHFYYAGRHIDLMSIRHAQGSALDLRPDAGVVAYALLQLVGAVASAAMLFRAAVREPRPPSQARPVLSAALVSAVVLVLVAIPAGYTPEADTLETRARLQNGNAARAFPEAALLWKLVGSEARGADAGLSPTLLEKLSHFGWSASPSTLFPLQRQTVFTAPPRLAGRGNSERPLNVIVVFLESFSLAFTSLSGGKYTDTTPNLAAFSTQGLLATNFYNSSTPTLNGLVSTLCSYYLPNHSESWYLGHNDFTRLYCLPRFLRGRGYHSQFNLVVERSYLQMGWLLENLGFDRVLDVADISAGLKQPPLSWGMSDHQMFRYLADNLAAGAYAPPFFVSFVTIDSHAPFNLAKDLAPSNETSPLLRTITSTDDAFGEFWRYFRSSPYFGNTMLVVLGDHQMFPGQQAAEAAREADATTFYGRIPLLIYDPTHQLPAEYPGLASQVDVAPTILHLLGLNGANAFEGNSLFEDRSRITGVLSMHESLFFTLQQSNAGPVRDTFGRDDFKGACEAADQRPSDRLTRCDYLQWHRWKAAVHAQNRVWP